MTHDLKIYIPRYTVHASYDKRGGYYTTIFTFEDGTTKLEVFKKEEFEILYKITN